MRHRLKFYFSIYHVIMDLTLFEFGTFTCINIIKLVFMMDIIQEFNVIISAINDKIFNIRVNG